MKIKTDYGYNFIMDKQVTVTVSGNGDLITRVYLTATVERNVSYISDLYVDIAEHQDKREHLINKIKEKYIVNQIFKLRQNMDIETFIKNNWFNIEEEQLRIYLTDIMTHLDSKLPSYKISIVNLNIDHS